MKVYIVTSGDYSDYSICAVFLETEKKDAIKVAKILGGSVEVYETGIPNGLPKDKLAFSITMKENGDSKVSDGSSEGYADKDYRVKNTVCGPNDDGCNNTEYTFVIWAKNKKHAVKVANEHRSFMIANNLWYPYSSGYENYSTQEF